MLATSREPLAIAQERVFRLGPLSLPDADGGVGAVVRSDAGRLFVDRAARINPVFALTPTVAGAIARICRELDGLPLALRLAAARLDTLSALQVAQGLSRRGRLSAAIGEDGLSQPRERSRIRRLALSFWRVWGTPAHRRPAYTCPRWC